MSHKFLSRIHTEAHSLPAGLKSGAVRPLQRRSRWRRQNGFDEAWSLVESPAVGDEDSTSRPLKKCSSNAPGSWISKKRIAQTGLRSDWSGHFGLFAGRFARSGRTYPMVHA